MQSFFEIFNPFSSTNRFILNSLLNSGHNKVYWFELDPGQPEFNLSGWLNLVEVKKARIGPGFAFLKSDLHYKEGLYLEKNDCIKVKKIKLK